MNPKDLVGTEIQVHDAVARAVLCNRSPSLEICIVTAIKDGKVYLDKSPQHIRYTDRLLVIKDGL